MQPTFFDSERMPMGDAIRITIASLREYAERYSHWAIAYSGGKDSTTLLTLVIRLIELGEIPRPARLTICYADTRMELPPLADAAEKMLAMLESRGYEVRRSVAEMDKRFYVYMLGRGVPPPNNATFRWCTRQIKVEPMHRELRRLYGEVGRKILMLTGVRVGESAARDQRIALSCGKNGAECGQGWFQETLSGETCDTLAPILHWRTCLVWDWLQGLLPVACRHDYPTRLVADAYGLHEEGSEAERAARTGCNGCPLATVDSALEQLLASHPKWGYLAPLKELRPLYRWLREPSQRLRKTGYEVLAGGRRRATGRLGPLTMDARRKGLATVLDIQARCNASRPEDLPAVDTLAAEEVVRIEDLIEANTWPRRWAGDEPTGDEVFERCFGDRSKQLNYLSPQSPSSASDSGFGSAFGRHEGGMS